MSLGKSVLVIASCFAVLAVLASAALILVSSYLHRAAAGIESAVESVHLAEQMEIQLLSHNRVRDSVHRLTTEESLQQMVVDAEAHVGSPLEQELMAEVTEQVEAYLLAWHRAAEAGASLEATQVRTGPEFEAAFSSIRRLIQLNVEQGRELKRMAGRWDELANVGGTAIAGLLLFGLAGLFFWTRKVAVKPAIELAHAIERYSSGEKSARAPGSGPAEFRFIATRFNAMAAALERQRETQLAFLAGVAHDLRNPLAALKMASALISADRPLPPEERIRQAFARVRRQVDRLDRMVFDFLDAARIEAGTLDIQLEECDVLEVVRASVGLFESTAPGHHIVLQAPEEPLRVSCDSGRLEQVLNNLISNAIKYSPGGGVVTVTIDREDADLVISVADEGVGIAPEDAAGLFEPFRRVGASRDSIPGTGLGLFVARRIIEAHGGRITLRTTPGKGSTFSVHLPSSARLPLHLAERGLESPAQA